MKILSRVLAACMLFLFLAAFRVGEAQQQETSTNKAGETLYKQRCAMCHEGAVPKAPNRAALKQMSAESVRFALVSGSMAVQGLGLTTAQITDLAEFLTGKLPMKEQVPAGGYVRSGCGSSVCGPARETALERLGSES